MWKDEIIKRQPRDVQLEKNINRFIKEIENMENRLSTMDMYIPLPQKAERPIKKALKALEEAEEALRDVLDEV
jgi:exonuclease VII small subunit